MTQKQIRRRKNALQAQRKKLDKEIDKARGTSKYAKHPARGKLLVVYAKLKALRYQCDHPDMYEYCCQADTGKRCPDCGYNI